MPGQKVSFFGFIHLHSPSFTFILTFIGMAGSGGGVESALCAEGVILNRETPQNSGGRGFLTAHRAGAGRLLPEAAQDCASLSHANNSTIGSNFCQARIEEK
jgi:hypothetical protein